MLKFLHIQIEFAMPSIDTVRIIPGTGKITYSGDDFGPLDTAIVNTGTPTLNTDGGTAVQPVVHSSLDFSNSENCDYLIFL